MTAKRTDVPPPEVLAAEYQAGTHAPALARKYKVNASAILKIIGRENWSEI